MIEMNKKLGLPFSKMKTIFVYGTLKRGHYNYKRFGMNQSEYLGNGIVRGYKMYTNGSYPGIIKTNNEEDVISGELFNVSEMLFNTLDMMETCAGYHIALVDINGIKDVHLFVIDGSLIKNWKLIKNGVW